MLAQARGQFLSLVSVLIIFSGTATSLGDESTVHLYEDGAGRRMWYRLYLPQDFDENTEYPLMTFLHGSDGTNIHPISNPEDVGRPPTPLVGAMESGAYSSILVAPQLEFGNWGSGDNDRLVLEALDSLQSTYRVNAQKRYITGSSLGGFGTFDMMYSYPDYFAAGVPVAGYGSTLIADTIKDIPVWVFHGDTDNIVSVEGSRTIVEALRQEDASPRYTEVPGGPHEIWNDVYDVDFTAPTVTFRLDADTVDKTFRLYADVSKGDNLGLYDFNVTLSGTDSVNNLAPKSEFTESAGSSLGFVNRRSGDNEFPIEAQQPSPFRHPETLILAAGQEPGMLVGAGTGTGEVQPVFDAPLLLAEGTYSELDALDFGRFDSPTGFPVAAGVLRQLSSGTINRRSAHAFAELLHDGVSVYRTGGDTTLYPWLYQQKLIPEPASVALLGMGMLLLFASSGTRKA